MLNTSSCKSFLGSHSKLDLESSIHVVTKQHNNQSGRSRIKYKMTPNFMGFTLIELLVVVLIIGILASIALPQYQKAVAKSRFAEALANLKTIASANQVCHMETGTHCNLNELAVDVGQEGVSSHFYYNTTNDSGEENTVWATAQYREEDVCLCYLRTGEIKVNQNEGGCTERDASFDYAKLLNLSKVDYNVCGCC